MERENYKQVEKVLVDIYNESRLLLKNVPPFYPFPIPEAEIKKGFNREEHKSKIVFDFDYGFFKNKNPSSPMAYRHSEGVIKVNPLFYGSPDNLNCLLWFPPLHEMIHVKEGVLDSKDLEFKHEDFPDFDFARVRELFENLKSNKYRAYKEFARDGEDLFVLCDFLARELLKDVVCQDRIGVNKQINWLTERLYLFNEFEWREKGGERWLPREAIFE